MPADLAGDAAVVWRRIVPRLVRRGFLGASDSDGLANYCRLRARLDACLRFLEQHGETYETRNAAGGMMHRLYPQAGLVAQLAGRCQAYEESLGATPRGRARLAQERRRREHESPTSLADLAAGDPFVRVPKTQRDAT